MFINSKTGTIATGRSTKNGEYKEIGEKNTPVLEFSLCVGNDENGNPIFRNCKAWNPIATRFKDRIIKGEKYLVAGTWEKREYNGKDYLTLVVDFIADMTNLHHVSDINIDNDSSGSRECDNEEDLPF